ncbi:MAG: TrmH family RNA methyltransferase [Phycisphaerae bacterium]
MNIRLKRYQKGFEHSYAYGVFPTIELLNRRPGCALRVLLSSKGEGSDGVARIRELCRDASVPVEVADRTLQRLGARDNEHAVGVFRKFEAPLQADADHVLLYQPGDMGNLGAIVRTMLAFDVLDLAVITPAADLFHPKVVRASMGGVFQIRFGAFTGLEDYRSHFDRKLYALATEEGTALPQAEFSHPWTLLLGGEGPGLPEQYLRAGRCVRIPQSARVDSLNLAVAAGVALYEAAGR